MALVPLLVPPPGPVLIAVPNALIRDQLVDGLESLSVLRNADVLCNDVPSPRVRAVTHRLGNDDAWLDAASLADFVVGTVSVLSPSHKDVAPPPRGFFGMLLVDEAHHVPAPTWSALAGHFTNRHRALVTATPVRSDGQPIPAELVFTYSLSDAMRDGVVAPVRFVPVVVPPGEAQDKALAKMAAARLRDVVHVAGRSRLIVRAGGVVEAETLVSVYAEAGLSLGLVTGSTTRLEYQRILASLDDDRLDGLVSVGVLGEGFDYPRLKIAVYHRKHQSLAPTLQFIGRIGRLRDGLGPAELLAVPDNDLSADTRALYESDSDWSRLLPGIADAGVERERSRRSYLDSMRDMRNVRLLPEPLTAAALRPAKDVLVYRLPIGPTGGVSVNLGAVRFSRFRGEVVLDRVSPDGTMRVLVTSRRSRVPWITSDAIDSEQYEIFIAVLDPVEPIIYVHAPSDAAGKDFCERLGLVDLRPEETGWISRFLHGLEVISYYSVGMRATRLPGGSLATYRTLAGNSVGKAVSSRDSIAYAAGHLILQAKNPFGDGAESSSVGVSMGRAKIWHAGRSDLDGFRRWCLRVGELGRSQATGGVEAPGLNLRIPQSLNRFPHCPLAALIDSRSLSGPSHIIVDGHGGSLAELELIPTRLSEREVVIVGMLGEHVALRARINTSGALSALHDDPGALCVLENAREAIPLIDVLEEKSLLTIYYADASSSCGNKLYTPPLDHVAFPDELLVHADWSAVDVRRESRPGRDGRPNIQEAMVAWHANQGNRDSVSWVLNDDGAGEVADLIVIRLPKAAFSVDGTLARPINRSSLGEVQVALTHCKWAGSDAPRRDLGDLDQVVGQAHRSLRWLANPTSFWQAVSARVLGRMKVVSGSEGDVAEMLDMFAAQSPMTTFEIQIVQPGLDIGRVKGWKEGETLLSFLQEATSSAGASLAVIGA